jgi:hypothetical protein
MVKKKTVKKITKVLESKEEGRHVVCVLPGGYTRDEFDFPQGKIITVNEKEFNQVKNLRGIIEVRW